MVIGKTDGAHASALDHDSGVKTGVIGDDDGCETRKSTTLCRKGVERVGTSMAVLGVLESATAAEVEDHKDDDGGDEEQANNHSDGDANRARLAA